MPCHRLRLRLLRHRRREPLWMSLVIGKGIEERRGGKLNDNEDDVQKVGGYCMDVSLEWGKLCREECSALEEGRGGEGRNGGSESSDVMTFCSGELREYDMMNHELIFLFFASF